ncbi:hypothetical protein [Amnibacterium sp.]|uniref:hypothetical protein n=1 Tax=Amnibacterium sp. TaxID=1872496 RepID=UPI0026225033|nr:hypothetical protein [Amnibacterium sp.]
MPRFVMRGRPAPEPTSRLPLAWGDYRTRYVLGVALLIAGAALVSETTAVTFSLGLVGSAVHLAGWVVQPGRPLARAAVALPSLVFCWCTITGPKTMWLLALVLPCWLLVRRRPPITYWSVALPLGLGLVLASAFSHVADKGLTFWTVVVGVILGAWLAREYALRVRLVHTDRIGPTPAPGPGTP